MRTLRWLALGSGLALYVSFGWVLGLVILAVAAVRLVLLAPRLARALAPAARCPAGHTVPQYGRFRCSSCGHEALGWAWRCAWCRASYGHMRCECGLSVTNPLR